jgi:CheY-like chemotaxis protein
MRQDREVEILLVEDNPADARLTMEAFKSSTLPHSLSHAQDGVEALEFLRRQGRFSQAKRPDLILLDLNLPRKDGRELLSDIKTDQQLRRIPVVVLTTSQAQEDIQRAYALYANCYICKPVQFDDFTRIVKSIEDFWLSTVMLPPE